MSAPIDLAAARAARQEPIWDGMVCGSCGGAWFTVQAVALNAECNVTSYMAPLTCHSCGEVAMDGAWVSPDLAPVEPT